MLKHSIAYLWAAIAAFGLGLGANAQCPAGQVAVTIQITTDGYGSETYWQLVPGGNACGVGTIVAGGNAAVGCNGGGLQNDPPGGYGNNFTTTVGPYCYTPGTNLTIQYVDDYGDGGINFIVFMDGVPTYIYNTIGQTVSNDSYDFVVVEPVADEISLTKPRAGEYSRIPASQISTRQLTCTLWNLGTNDQIGVTVTANVYANGNPTPVFTLTSSPVTIIATGNANVNIGNWNPPATPSNYEVEFEVNTTADTDPSNNTGTASLQVSTVNYARDIGPQVGGLGVNAGNVRQGQVFTVNMDEVLTSIEANITGGTLGDSIRAEVYPISGTTPGAMIASTPIIQLPSAGPGWMTFTFAAPPLLTAGDYLIVINHLDASPSSPAHNIGLGYTNDILTADKQLLSIANGVWQTTNSLGFSVCYMLRANLGTPPAFDLALVTPDFPAIEYTRYPLNQLTGPLAAGGYVSNIGAASQSGVVLTVEVFQDGNFATPVYSASSPATTIPANDTVLISTGTFTPTAQGRYTFRYEVELAGEVDITNNFGESDFYATNNEFARDNGVRVGSVGIGSGPSETPLMGQNFALNVNTRLDSVSFFLANPHVTDTIKVLVYSTTPDFSGPNVLFVPNVEVARTATYTITANTANNWITLPLNTPIQALGGDVFSVVVFEGDSNMSLGTTAQIFTPGAGWVNWQSSPAGGWANNEEFGAPFARPLMLRLLSQSCPAYDATAVTSDVTCNGANDGELDVTIANGTGLTYDWSHGPTTEDVTGLAPGSYTLTVEDADGCQSSFSFQVIEPTVLAGNASGTNPTAAGATDGSVVANITGGTAPYTYSLNGGAGQSSNTFNGLAAGTYTVTVTDDNGCTFNTAQVTLTDVVGTPEITGLAAWEVYPNPTNGMLNVRIQFAEPTEASLELLDLTGRTVRTATAVTEPASELRLDLTTLPAGSYLLRLRANGQVATQSIVRQ